MKSYLIEGIFSCLHILPITTICYIVFFVFVWLIGIRKPSLKLIPSYILEFVLICYTCTLLNITGILNTSNGLFPQFTAPNFQETLHIPFVGASFQMVLLNFLMFVPFGLLLSLVIHFKKQRLFKAITIAVVFSIFIEIIQIFIGRFFEIDDIISNSLGAVAGAFLWQGIYWIKSKRIAKGIIGIALTLVISYILIFGISFIANGDSLQKEVQNTYSELPNETELENNLNHIDISVGVNSDTIISSKTLFEDIRFANVYSELKIDISNNISQYQPEQIEDIVCSPNDTIVSIYLNEPQTFTFYNNRSIVMSDVISFSYDIADGTLWYIDTIENTYKLSFIEKHYAFISNDDLLANATDIMQNP